MNQNQVGSHFDSLAEDYKAITTQQHAFFDQNTSYLQEYKVAIAHELVSSPKQVLDYGCGIGLLQGFLSTYYPAATITATDISEKSLDYVRSNHPRTVTVLDEEALKSHYDLILVSCVLHHVPPCDRKVLLERLVRALSPGGHILVFEHNPLNPVTQHLVNTCPVDDDAILLRRSELVGILNSIEEATVVKTGYTLFFPGALKSLRPLEKHIRWLPAGGQYFVFVSKTGDSG
jgi:2-polyprenyl-3-methyl-5-hydroxy-6-metoxy-1,4-benzoquinol methylase